MRRWREKAATVWTTGASGGRGGGGRDPCRPPPAQQRGAGHRGHGRLASASARERGTEATSACRVTGQRLHVREHRYRKPAESGPQAGADHRGHGLRVCEHEGDTDPRGTRQIREGRSGSGGSSSCPSAACDTPAQGLIGLIGYSYQQVATFFRKPVSKELRS